MSNIYAVWYTNESTCNAYDGIKEMNGVRINGFVNIMKNTIKNMHDNNIY